MVTDLILCAEIAYNAQLKMKLPNVDTHTAVGEVSLLLSAGISFKLRYKELQFKWGLFNNCPPKDVHLWAGLIGNGGKTWPNRRVRWKTQTDGGVNDDDSNTDVVARGGRGGGGGGGGLKECGNTEY